MLDLAGRHHTVEGATDAPLMQALKERDLVSAVCGGMCSCGTCHVRVARAWQAACGAAEPVEADLLSALEAFGEGSRLSCQITLSPDLDGLEVELLPEE